MSGQPNRIAGGLVERSRTLAFTFDGKAYIGHEGDTLASALLANGVKLVGRSFKYHRPRGIMTAGPEEPNALVELRTGARREPNTKATVAELYDGLDAQSQNRWPSLDFDVGAVNSLLSPFFVAGFYYKTFMWPASFWEKIYEPAIRRAAGLGRVSMEADPDHYEKAYAYCDVLVIGAGPAGLAAALAAGRSGARVILADEDFSFGGRLLGDRREVAGMAGSDWAGQAVAELASLPNVRLMRRTTVFGAYDGNEFGLLERVSDHLPVPPRHLPRQRMWRVVARRAVLASGAIERPIAFGGNDRPGVMTASAVRTYVNRFGVAPGRRVTVFTSSDDGWRTVADLRSAGVAIEAVIDSRRVTNEALRESAAKGGTRLIEGGSVIATKGAKALSSITVADANGGTHEITTDCLAVSGGFNPNLAVTTHLGGKPRWSDDVSAFVPSNPPAHITVAGSVTGRYGLADALRDGATAGADAAAGLGFAITPAEPLPCDDDHVAVSPLWHVAASKEKAFVDFQHDVTVSDVALAEREGFRAVELLKRYTTLGMATDQGKTSAVTGHAIMAALTGQPMEKVGTTVARPPYTPVAIAALAGHHRGKDFKPTRLTAGHAWAVRQGAVFTEAGQWLRAQWFPRPGETDWLQSVNREVKAVRESVGICDVSTLGKIDIQGPDAGEFLNRVYINAFAKLAIGKARYGVMLREDGFVMDDGTTARFGETHYVMSTTTANAGPVMMHLEFCRQVLWPELDVQLVSVTEQWSQYAMAGPNARRVLERLLGDALDVSNEAFPFMGVAEFAWRGVPTRLFRISFSGELAYEIAVPARYGEALVEALMEAGRDWDITPYGTEALSVMRIEKGHVAGGELNGQTTAADLGLGRMMSTKKDFIGRVLAGRPGLADPDRPTLVGVKPVDPSQRIRAGAHVLGKGAEAVIANDEGYLTSVAHSPILGHWIGLALVKRGPERHGEIMRAYDPVRGGDTEVELCSPVFYDPEGTKHHG
ncbi:sarcosine oxidase subunit alpha family protein [Lutibaculum baratangense]|uniref:Sarcosine oxidase alpha subunit n=1 Tax=Lutibaculum baratangense AMV1 TaxID=631454 RepID=V4RED7_9HYPH|nr:sarcosine oxidase subunit alpha family protein [Lutibaculum baratangense]ESR24496.1 Sarcosine oxidase alpha subunit [Lutibaculum baratangense AMV1]